MFALMTETHSQISKFLYYARHYLLNASGKFIFLLDLGLSSLVTLLACYYGEWIYKGDWVDKHMGVALLFDLAVTGTMLWRSGVYKTLVRFTTMKDLQKLMAAILLASMLLCLFNILLWPAYYKGHVVCAIFNFVITFLVLIGCRMACIGGRRWLEHLNSSESVSSLTTTGRKRIALVGKLDACLLKASLIRSLKSEEYEVVGILTSAPEADGKEIKEIPIRLIKEAGEGGTALNVFQASGVIFGGKDDLLGDKKLADVCLEKGIELMISHDLFQSFHEYSGVAVDEVQIEDLMEREEISIDMEKISGGIKGRVVMVTGAAGSIGSELVRQLCRFSPRRIVLLDHAETPLWLVRQEVEKSYPHVPVATSITNVCHRRQLEESMKLYRPDVIFHAAAYKHVPLMEENPCTAVVNNVKGAMHLASLAVKYGVQRFVMVSTDKAVNPTSVMGATKRLAEMYVQSLGEALLKKSGKGATVFITTRFGNVLGSAGSVIPLFKEQIRKGGPVTVTHPEMIRYFMTIPEACRLILQANAMGKGGEIFVFDMGEQVRIVELAKKMIRLAGLSPLKDIRIVFTGLRPGEKLYEELLADYEHTLETSHQRIRIFQTRKYDMSELKEAFEELVRHAEAHHLEDTIRAMKQLIPEYKSNNSPYAKYDYLDLKKPLTI